MWVRSIGRSFVRLLPLPSSTEARRHVRYHPLLGRCTGGRAGDSSRRACGRYHEYGTFQTGAPGLLGRFSMQTFSPDLSLAVLGSTSPRDSAIISAALSSSIATSSEANSGMIHKLSVFRDPLGTMR